MFEEGLITFLSAAGTDAGDRIYPRTLPQTATFPAIVYLEVSSGLDYTHSGESSLEQPRYQFDCYADGQNAYYDSKALAAQVRDRLSGYHGMMGNYEVQAGFIEGIRDGYDPDTGRYWVSMDIFIHHQN